MPVYSLDLRERIVEAVQRGESKAKVARRFGVNRSTVYAYLEQKERKGHLEPKRHPGPAPALDEQDLERLGQQLHELHDATLEEHREFWRETTGQNLSVATVHRAFNRLGVTRKKRRS